MAKKNSSARGQNDVWSATPVTVADTNPHNLTPFSMQEFDYIALQLHTTGTTLAGTWTIEGSNDYSPGGEYNERPNAGNWFSITALFDSIAAVTAGAPTVRGTNALRSIGYKYIRPVFTASAGSGTILGYPSAKGAE